MLKKTMEQQNIIYKIKKEAAEAERAYWVKKTEMLDLISNI